MAVSDTLLNVHTGSSGWLLALLCNPYSALLLESIRSVLSTSCSLASEFLLLRASKSSGRPFYNIFKASTLIKYGLEAASCWKFIKRPPDYFSKTFQRSLYTKRANCFIRIHILLFFILSCKQGKIGSGGWPIDFSLTRIMFASVSWKLLWETNPFRRFASLAENMIFFPIKL